MLVGTLILSGIAGIVIGIRHGEFFNEKSLNQTTSDGTRIEECTVNLIGYGNCTICWDCLTGTCNSYLFSLISAIHNTSNTWVSPCGCGRYPHLNRCLDQESELVFYGMRPSRKQFILITVMVGSGTLGLMVGGCVGALILKRNSERPPRSTRPISMTVKRGESQTTTKLGGT
jgi:hypothetical protein